MYEIQFSTLKVKVDLKISSSCLNNAEYRKKFE